MTKKTPRRNQQLIYSCQFFRGFSHRRDLLCYISHAEAESAHFIFAHADHLHFIANI